MHNADGGAMRSMWAGIKRLLLGIVLIVLASAVLLVSDRGHRTPGANRVLHLAILQQASQQIIDDGVRGMVDGLAENGFVDGRNISIRRYNAEGDTATSNTIAKEITDGRYDLVLTATTVSMQAVASANRAGKTMHVFGLVSDPFAAGVGLNRDRPLEHPRHLVGYGTLQPVAETFRVARQMFPGLTVVGEVWNPAETNSEVNTRLAREACGKLGIELIEANVDNTAGVKEAASSLISRGVQALWVGGDVTVVTAIDQVITTARQAHIPVFTSMPGSSEKGALFDIGANYHEVGRLAGVLAAQILRGTDPATIEVTNVLPETIVVNKTAVEGLNDPWQLPEEFVRKADTVIDAHGVHKAAARPSVPAARVGALAPPPDRVFKVGLVYFAPDPGADICMQGLFDGLRDRGFVEGKNLEVRKAHAQGEIANIPALFQHFDSQGLDLIVPMSTPCLTGACGTVKNTPVVFTYVYDPIAAGAGASFTEHLPNVTGVGSFPPVDDTVAMIQKLVPGVQTVGTIYNSSEANSRKVVRVAREAFTKHGLRLEEVSVTNASEVFEAAQALVARRVQALWITGDNTALQAFDAIVKVATDAHLPIINNDPEFVARGALACVGIGFYNSGYAAAQKAAQVLLGTKPAEIPIENVVVQTLSLNLVVAHRLGVTFPEELTRAADEIVDETGVHKKSVAHGETPGTHARLAKTWKVDVLEYVNVEDVEDGEKGIRAGLHDAGLVEGRDFEIRIRNAQGDMPTLSTLVDAALGDGADLLITLSTPTLQAAMQRARGLPIVFTFVANAIAAGAGRSNDDHLPNVTGVPTTAAYGEAMDVLQECLPHAHRIGTVFVPAEVNSVFSKDQVAGEAERRGLEFVAVAANTSAEVADATLSLLTHGIDAICQVGGNLTTAGFASIAQPAQHAKIPVFGFLSNDARNGAAVVLARDYFDGGHEAATMAARIMRGENPAAIPFKPLRKTKLLVNLTAARAYGVAIPASVLKRADGVIGR